MSKLGNSDLFDFSATVVRESEKAWQLDVGEANPVWMPKSLVEDNGDGTFTAPEWLCKEKGIV